MHNLLIHNDASRYVQILAVMVAALSEARNTAASAIFCGETMRPSGELAVKLRRDCSSLIPSASACKRITRFDPLAFDGAGGDDIDPYTIRAGFPCQCACHPHEGQFSGGIG